MIRRPPRSTLSSSSAASDVYKRQSLSSIFRPEFLNRIDEVVKFDPLSIDQLQKIILLQIEDLKKLLLEQGININIDKKVIQKIANDSYEP